MAGHSDVHSDHLTAAQTAIQKVGHLDDPKAYWMADKRNTRTQKKKKKSKKKKNRGVDFALEIVVCCVLDG